MRNLLLTIALTVGLTACELRLPGSSAPALPPGSVLFRDDFSSPQTGWDRTKYAEGIMDYDSGSYRILVNARQTDFWSSAHRSFQNVRLEVDAGKFGGPDENRAGLFCRSDGHDYYFFIVSSDGYYGLGIFAQGEARLLSQTAMQATDAVIQGAAVNHLRLDCKNDELIAFANGNQLADVHDSQLKQGEVGVLAGTFDEPGVDIVFDNFIVLQP